MAQSAEAPGSVDRDDPRHWVGPSPLMDLEDPKLRLRVRALTQLAQTEREKALAIYSFVKRMPVAKHMKLRLRSARQVHDAGRGDSPDKATLLVAMLRIAGLPARIRYVLLKGEILRGITTRVRQAGRPVVEVWLNGAWLATDTYILDAAYMAAARQRLKECGWEWGYGIHVAGHMVWDGHASAWLGGVPTERDPMVLRELGLFHDPLQYTRSRAYREQHSGLARMLHWNMLAPVIDRAYRSLRQERAPADRRRPRIS